MIAEERRSHFCQPVYRTLAQRLGVPDVGLIIPRIVGERKLRLQSESHVLRCICLGSVDITDGANLFEINSTTSLGQTLWAEHGSN